MMQFNQKKRHWGVCEIYRCHRVVYDLIYRYSMYTLRNGNVLIMIQRYVNLKQQNTASGHNVVRIRLKWKQSLIYYDMRFCG